MVRSLDGILFLSVYNTKGRALSAKLVWLLVTRFGGMPLEQMEVFLFSDPSLGASTGHQWNVTQSSLDHRAGFWRTTRWTVLRQGRGDTSALRGKKKNNIKPFCAVHHLFCMCHKAHQELGLFVSMMWWPVTQGTSPQRGHREMGACWGCRVWAISGLSQVKAAESWR